MKAKLQLLSEQLEGDLFFDTTMRTLYATDASAYREMPLAVAIPRTREDIRKLIAFAAVNQTSLIPRTAGTSLAGQVVGNGIVVDVSRHCNRILEINPEEKWVKVEPGVIRDELNLFLKPYGLYFGPETSTANRAMIGGMVGNNSCGSNSVVYRSTREHLLEVKAFLSDGSEAVFGELDVEAFHEKCELPGLEGKIYRQTRSLLGQYENQVEIRKEFPKRSVERRNTGYAIDLLVDTEPFTAGGDSFNFCSLIAGSEGTLAFLTEIKLNLVPLPPRETGLLCVHFNTIDESLRANLIGLKYRPSASELIDHYILECTKENIEQRKNRFFVQGDPGAILVIEFLRNTREEILAITEKVEAEMRAAGLGYHFPVLFGDDTKKIWTLRKAGLGLLGNLPGDEKAVPVIEDTAVDVNDLPAYIREFNEILARHGLHSVHYAHAGSGELHLRPIINLKTEEGNRLFRAIAADVATLVKKYQGSLSGEHGDGRLRGEFIRQMVGEKNYRLLQQIKECWDPQHIFNPNKIVDTPPMNTMLRYEPGQFTPEFKTIFRFHQQNILQHAEQCNGSGDCRKTHLSGGTMCPSFMATRNEKDTTRARANILREFLTRSDKMNRFDHQEIYEVMDLCLSCKACKSECPSNVDMAKLKAEFLQQYYDIHGVPFRSRLIANFSTSARLGSLFPSFYNFFVTNALTGSLVKWFSGFAQKRSMPTLSHTTLRSWYAKHRKKAIPASGRKLFLFCDEFTNYNDAHIGITAIQLLEKLGYTVEIPKHEESGRTWLSKGLVRKAQQIINRNIEQLAPLVSADMPLIGIEPSAILTFRDEYPDLAYDHNLEAAREMSKHVFLIDEFIAAEIEKGNITKEAFTREKKLVKLHGHCQQKSVSNLAASVKMLSLPEHYTVETIPSGCCGMAGSFGFEKEHYDISMQIGELVLFPTVRQQQADTLIAAPGTSCRHQVKDGTGREALHTVEVLYQALRG
ncbi:MAG: FAD-binding protein [Chitinophagaceae bacterium]|nr:FAD-binding protein [Chitinophagaceae bacterium]MCA6451745.1 FAD-binding protein [Chitinophagaceae bacterium]MCA6454663.1 FAD-binding protein [Chitinophagaceae bacterium]MCA6457641.1 FAD-binding protein [Chitinophagaceae bacterium]MCA6463354.1 FAD-binding protein [Chitinophagaceae bacterium]